MTNNDPLSEAEKIVADEQERQARIEADARIDVVMKKYVEICGDLYSRLYGSNGVFAEPTDRIEKWFDDNWRFVILLVSATAIVGVITVILLVFVGGYSF